MLYRLSYDVTVTKDVPAFKVIRLVVWIMVSIYSAPLVPLIPTQFYQNNKHELQHITESKSLTDTRTYVLLLPLWFNTMDSGDVENLQHSEQLL